MRQFSPIDRLLCHFDTALRTVAGQPVVTARDNPADAHEEAELTDAERTHAGRLMRVNHAGEVAAQGLYQGQALTARLEGIREQMQQAALEENDHLDWCAGRARELGTHTSYLGPLWYGGALAIGALAGAAGDKWSLGFVVETENQVVRHLEGHLAQLPAADLRSRAILEQMQEDEARHAATAQLAGAHPLPQPVSRLMAAIAGIMTSTAYWI